MEADRGLEDHLRLKGVADLGSSPNAGAPKSWRLPPEFSPYPTRGTLTGRAAHRRTPARRREALGRLRGALRFPSAPPPALPHGAHGGRHEERSLRKRGARGDQRKEGLKCRHVHKHLWTHSLMILADALDLISCNWF